MWVYLVKYVICIPETEGNNSKDNRVNKSFKRIIAGAVSDDDDDDVLVDLTDYIEGLQRSSSCSSFTIKRQKKTKLWNSWPLNSHHERETVHRMN